jgi:predicted TIM-barrel enzyme
MSKKTMKVIADKRIKEDVRVRLIINSLLSNSFKINTYSDARFLRIKLQSVIFLSNMVAVIISNCTRLVGTQSNISRWENMMLRELTVCT